MSTLLEQASLVLIPSGYKEDVVYSQIPTSGAGDLSFTRASNGTRVNSAGLVEVCPWNLVQQSESIGTSPWLTNGATLTSGQTDPNGGTTAIKVQLASGGNNYVYQGIPLTNPVNIVSAYLRADSATTIGFSMGGSTPNAVNLTTSWQLFTFSSTDTSGGIIFDNYFGPSPTQQAKTFYIWHPQLNIGSTAKPYFPTTDRLNVPRLTYQNGGGGCPSLLLEKQSTNLFSYSEQFDNAYWSVVEVSVGANVITSPDGTQNADSIIDNANSGRHIIYRELNGNLATTRTLSLYAKQNSLRYLFMSVTNAGDFHCYSAIFDLQTGVISATKVNGDGTLSASIQSVGNGYYRCIISGTMTSGTANFYPLIGTSDRAGFTGSLFSNNAPIYAGSGQSIYIWGAQVEESSYPTSYIPTTSASATRVADACSKTGISSLIGQTEGTLFADFLTGGLPSIDQYYMNISDGSTSNIIYIGFYANILVARIIDAGSLIVNINVGLATNTRYKVGFAYKANDCVLYINGSNSGSDTSTTVPATSKLSFNDFSNEACYQLNESVLFKTRLTNAELASITSL